MYLVHLSVKVLVRRLIHVQWCEGDGQGRDDILVERGGRGTVHETRGAEEGGGLAEEGRYASTECVCACVRVCGRMSCNIRTERVSINI